MKLSILIGKIAGFLLGLFGRGSSLPGGIALKLNKNLLAKMKLPGTIIAVTGSNGKTSTTELLVELAETTGQRVIGNVEGSNQLEGVATLFLKHSTLRGQVEADIAILECDERFCQYIFKYFSPTAIVLTNLFRDQLTRNGHNEFVAKELKKGLPANTVLIANADDPLVALLARDNPRSLFYGVLPEVDCEAPDTPHAYFDGAVCPVCHRAMLYNYRIHNHVGDYYCPTCGFAHPETTHAVTDFTGGEFIVDGVWPIKPQLPNLIFAYNNAAAFTAAVEVLGLSGDEAAAALSGYSMKNDRVRSYDIAGHACTFLLSKHENSIAYDQNLRFAVTSDGDEKTVVLIVDQLSRKYGANDMSWLWDVDFELLADARVKRVLVSGNFSNDVAARLLLGGVEKRKIWAEQSIDAMMEQLYADAVGGIFVLTCFTDENKFTRRLREEQL